MDQPRQAAPRFRSQVQECGDRESCAIRLSGLPGPGQRLLVQEYRLEEQFGRTEVGPDVFLITLFRRGTPAGTGDIHRGWPPRNGALYPCAADAVEVGE